jgi:hypothetical protein
MPLGIAALDDLTAAAQELRLTLDGHDAPAIDAAVVRVAQSAASVRAIGAWRSEPAVADRLKALLPLLESARIRSSLLADHAAQRLSLLAAHGATTAPLTYRR